MLKRLLALSMLLVILEIPLNKWRSFSEDMREGIRKSATTSFMRKLEPGAIARVWEEIRDGKWQLHIEPTDRCLPRRDKETI